MRALQDDLFELVFERLDQPTATALSRTLLGYEARLPTERDGVHEVSVESLVLRPGVALDDVHVRLLCYDESVYDVELNFRLPEAKAPSNDAFVAALHDFASDLAEANGVATYFAGLEPASDESTRMFTGKEKGPYYGLS